MLIPHAVRNQYNSDAWLTDCCCVCSLELKSNNLSLKPFFERFHASCEVATGFILWIDSSLDL